MNFGNKVGWDLNRRCLTLLEVLIVVGLLLGMAAIVAPSVLNTLDEQAFETAADVTGEQLMLARAHAQATGQSVEVRYRPGESRVEARFFLPWMMSYQLAAGEPAQDDSSQRSESTGNSASDSAIAEAWASRAISKSVRIGSQRLVNGEGDIRHATSNLDYAAAIEAELTNTDDVRLAVFMPDGTALLNDPFWFEDDGGRVGRLTINPFSGLPAWERLLDLTDPMPTEDEFNSPAGIARDVPNDVGTDHGASFGDGGATARPR
jgi:Tfp pilus assembly protein FimT